MGKRQIDEDRPPGPADVPGRAPPRSSTGPVDIRCLTCGSTDLDASRAPRGDEPVRCRRCGEWDTYATLEAAAVEVVRRSLAQREGP
jgi:hypothetical protein